MGLSPVGFLLAAALVAASCASVGTPPNASDGVITAPTIDADPSPCTADPILSTESNVTGSGLDWIFGLSLPDSFPEPLLAGSSVVPVLSADSIASIDQPACLPSEAVDFLTDNAPVLSLEVNEEARAYPLEILTWHELVNDTVGGEPVTVSYCPLCNSAIVYDRRLGERILDFGTSGALSQSSMIMYDRQTETLWTHFNGQAVVGELAGEKLRLMSASVVSWADFREQFPDGKVLSRETGFNRDYGRNPYPGYEDAAGPYAQFITEPIDPRLDAKVRVVGVEIDGDAIALVRAPLFRDGVVDFEVGGVSLTAWNLPGTASALDGGRVSAGDDVGATGVFMPFAGQPLSFERRGAHFVDVQTGSIWTILGKAIDGPLAGQSLEKVHHVDTFWFAWGSFFQGTAILG